MLKTFNNITICKLKIIASNIAKNLQNSNIILLEGTLGTGKTTFIKYMLKLLGIDTKIITSPTFNLVHQYYVKGIMIWHFDLYRINDFDELISLNIEDAFSIGICLIEWGNIVKPILTKYTEIKISYTKRRNIRKIILINRNI